MPKVLNNKLLEEIGSKTVNLAANLSYNKRKERWLHGVVLGMLELKVGNMQIEYPVKLLSDGKASRERIDFRYESTNPVFIELCVRAQAGEHYGSQNLSELKKLCKISGNRARRRVLMVLDPLSPEPFDEESLKSSYAGKNAGPGRFTREAVTVMYFHPKRTYSFRWRG